LTSYLDALYQDTVRVRYAAQQTCLEADGNATLLDVGCHGGVNPLRLAQGIGARRVVGVEITRGQARQALRRGIEVVIADANRPLPLADASVSVVTAMDVIEHLYDPARLIREATRALKPGGYLVVATPNLASWHNVFALVLGLQPFSGPNLTSMLDADVAVVRRLHRRAYDLPEDGQEPVDADDALHRHLVVSAYRSLLRLMEQNGLAVEYARGFGYYPLPAWLGRLASRLDPAHAHHMVIKARKPATDKA
jgi:SAM-dependent methyltransferase